MPPLLETEWGITSLHATGWYMPKRKIKKNYRSVTGVFPGNKSIGPAEFESTLERDLIILLEFAPQVLQYEVQPITIPWVDSEGKKRNYTPDALVKTTTRSIPQLLEVKYKSDLSENWQLLKEKHAAARKWATSKGLKFNVITENNIRGTYLENAKFLLNYSKSIPPVEMMELVLNILNKNTKLKVNDLLAKAFHDEWRQAQLLTVVWYLVATFQIDIDLNKKLTMESKLKWKP